MSELVAALRRAGLRDVDDSALARSLYASDASIYRVEPRVVVRPRSEDELVAVMAVARESGTPLTMRGAGTSIAGNAIGPGIVVDTRRWLNQVLEVDPEAGSARVRPGTVHAHLQRATKPYGLRFGPDPSTHTRCTIGGMIGNNACGSRALGYGRTADNVLGLRVLLADGTVLDTSAGLAGLTDLVDADLALVRTEFGKFGRQVSGYSFEHLLPENGRRLDRFLVGTEGTLAVVLDATVRLVQDAPARALAVLGYPDMASAADAVGDLLAHPLVACEGLDRRIVDLVSGAPELPAGDGWLFAEVTADTEAEAAALASEVAATAGVPHRVVTDPGEQAALWRIREDGAGLAARSLSRPAHAGWEDAAVPPQRLGAYLRELDSLMNSHGLDGVPYGHFGDGCVHLRIDFELDSDAGRRTYRAFIEEAADQVAGYGGSMSGEHGDGRARSELLNRMYSPRAIALMAAAKHALDPGNLLNPGVLVDPRPFDADLRQQRPVLPVFGSLGAEVHRCTGVGKCLAGPGNGVMCPSYAATTEEKDSTRGRARVLQDVVTGVLDVNDPAVHDALDLCLACKGCASDCPTGVDVGTWKAEVLDRQYAGAPHRRPRSHHFLGRLPRLAALTPARIANRMLANPVAAAALKRAAGVDPRRTLPRFSEQTLRASWRAGNPGSKSRYGRDTPMNAARARLTIRSAGDKSDSSVPDVWVWADSFTDHFAAGSGRAAVELLRGAGFDVRVIEPEACCALTWISTGQLDAARHILGKAVATLAAHTAVAPVIGLEPSCLATLRHDAARLLPKDPAVRQVAAGMKTLAEFLTEQNWTPPDLSGYELVAQPHCHHQSVLGWDADHELLRRAGARVTKVPGCCGLAGNFGVEQGHFEVSRAVYDHDLGPAVEASPDALVLADGFSCRTQLADFAPGRRSVHLAELLLEAGDGRTSA